MTRPRRLDFEAFIALVKWASQSFCFMSVRLIRCSARFTLETTKDLGAKQEGLCKVAYCGKSMVFYPN